MSNFKNKIVLITGGHSGIGYATAKALQEKEAKVIISGRRKQAVEKAASELNATGLIAEQSYLPAIEYLASMVAYQFGKIDGLIISARMPKFAPIASMTENGFDTIMNVNFKGAYFTLSKFIPLLNDNASVVLLSSASAAFSLQSASVYEASKAAINAVVKIAALELASQKIRVNTVSPGPIATEIMNKIGLDDSLEVQLVNSVPLSRFGQPGEVADLITYLLSDNASFITGANFLIDGGLSI